MSTMNDVNKAFASYGIKRLKVMDRFSMHLEKVWCTTFRESIQSEQV